MVGDEMCGDLGGEEGDGCSWGDAVPDKSQSRRRSLHIIDSRSAHFPTLPGFREAEHDGPLSFVAEFQDSGSATFADVQRECCVLRMLNRNFLGVSRLPFEDRRAKWSLAEGGDSHEHRESDKCVLGGSAQRVEGSIRHNQLRLYAEDRMEGMGSVRG